MQIISGDYGEAVCRVHEPDAYRLYAKMDGIRDWAELNADDIMSLNMEYWQVLTGSYYVDVDDGDLVALNTVKTNEKAKALR